MRIISGNHKGKKIVAPDTLAVRPTTDLAKESLFNILANYFYLDSVSVLDLFAGTGNISYEFAARTKDNVVAVDINSACVNFIRKTSQTLSLDNLSVVRGDALAFLASTRQAVNIIFADPPFDWTNHTKIIDLVFEKQLLLPNGFLIIEHPQTLDFQSHPKQYQQRTYGKVNFSIFAENL
jgi:16S rRNA (guanine(966)-N(2))-methyltransferase RsmD